MAEVKAGDGAAEQRVAQRALLAGRQVGQQDRDPRGVGPRRPPVPVVLGAANSVLEALGLGVPRARPGRQARTALAGAR